MTQLTQSKLASRVYARNKREEFIEEWRPIEGYEGYFVSNTGKVKSTKRRPEGKLLKPNKKKDGGHLRVCLYKDGKVWSVEIQTLVASAFIGPRPYKNVVRHMDGNPENNNLWNLKYGTHEDNFQDSLKHGTAKLGERHLIDVQVSLIHMMKAMGYKAKEVAYIFNISEALAFKHFKRANR